MPLLSVTIAAAAEIGFDFVVCFLSLNGIVWCFFPRIETKNPNKTVRLASELTGMEGMVDATTWEKVPYAPSVALQIVSPRLLLLLSILLLLLLLLLLIMCYWLMLICAML